MNGQVGASEEPAGAGVRSDPLGVVAGGGRLPREVADSVAATGRPVVVFRIRGVADDPEPGPHETHTFGYGQIGAFFDFLAKRGITQLAFAGTIRRRPDFTSIGADLGTLKRIPRILKAVRGGDDTVIGKVMQLFEAEGCEVVPLGAAAPGLLAPPGALGRAEPSDADRVDIERGLAFLAATAPFDVGQAVVVVDGRIVASEAAEGTDAMLERCAVLRAEGRYRARGRRGVLVKVPKRGQDLRTDLPVIGLQTIERSVAAELSGIAVAAGGTIVVERAETTEVADRAGLFVEGIVP